MSGQRRRDTKPELHLRRELWRHGYRYRVDYKVLPGLRRRADLVFVDGCFWHNCPEHGTLPKANREWWRAKLDANDVRDRDTDERREASGWVVIRVWEHEPVLEAVKRVADCVYRRQ